MIKELGRVNSEGYEGIVFYNESTGKVWFIGDLDIDADGGKNVDGDPDWQPDTSLHHNGKPIDALAVPAMVVPGWLPAKVKPIVLGCQGRLTNLSLAGLSGVGSIACVVHDTGPKNKVGEATPAAAKLIGINPNSKIGGEEKPVVLFECWPGTPALVNGILYELQKS